MATLPTVVQIPLDTSRIVALAAQYQGWERYERDQHHVVITTAAFSFPFFLTNIDAGGASAGLSFAYPKYGLLFNGVERATYTRTGSERAGIFAGTLGSEADGPYQTEIVAYDASGNRVAAPVECLLTFWLWVDRNGTAKNDPSVVVQNGVFDWMHDVAGVATPPNYVYTVVPKSLFVPQARPLTPQVPVPFADAVNYSKLTLIPYVSSVSGTTMNRRRPCLTKRGITVCDNQQSYYKEQVFGIQGYPSLPLLDGARGTATIAAPTWMLVGRNQKVLGGDAYSAWIVDNTGTVRRFAGLRHKYAPYWEDCAKGGPEVETVGDWDASIPAAERFPWECWGAVFDPRTLALDTAAAPIGGEQPHVGIGPVLFMCDRHGYVLRLQFNGGGPAALALFGNTDRTAPPKITRFFAANDPWAIGFDEVDNTLIVNERKAHRISKWSADSGAWVKDVLANPAGPSWGQVNDTVRGWQFANFSAADVSAGKAAAAARAAFPATCLAPEGGALFGRWWYCGAYALGEVRRVNLDTGQVQAVCRPPMADWLTQTAYIYLRISDGTFGPAGTVFCSTFAINGINAFLPTAGTDPDGTALTNSAPWHWVDLALENLSGPGGVYANFQYPMGFDVGKGMLAAGSSNFGLEVHMLADPSAVQLDGTRINRGWAAYRAAGYDVLFDQYGYSNIGVPIPTDNADIAYALAWEHQYEAASSAQLPVTQPPIVQPPVTQPPVTQPPVQPPEVSVGFKSVSKTASSTYPPLPPTGQRLELHLHGSGGGFDPSSGVALYTAGDTYVGLGDTTLGLVDGQAHEWHVNSGGFYGSTQIPPNPPPFVQVNPVDKITPPGHPNGLESNWSGYVHDGLFSPYTERWLDALLDWSAANLPIDPKCAVLTGNSMGAWGGVAMGLRRPDRFAAVTVSQPRWRATSVADWATTGEFPPPGLKLDDGSDFAATYDSVAYVADKTHRLPLLVWTVATGDTFTPFAEHQAAIAAYRARIRDATATNAQRTGFAVGWIPGAHGAAGPQTAPCNALIWAANNPGACYDPSGWRTDLGYPVFDHSSRDDDPLTAAQGFINNGFKWRNVVEATGAWSCEISNTLGATTVDVYPHSDVFTGQVSAPQHVTIPAGQWVSVSFAATQQAPMPPITPVPPDPLQAQLDAANATIAQLTADKAALVAHLALLGADVDAIVAAAAKAQADA